MRKSNFATDLKGPQPVREWSTMDPSKDGSPCVIKRRFKYWQTNLKRLSKAEARLAAYRERPIKRQHRADIEALGQRIENRLNWVQFSADTLRNSVRFARARISPNTEDYKVLMQLCPSCKIDTATLRVPKPFVSVKLENGKTQLRCESCFSDEPLVTATHGVKRRPRGRLNKKFHKELRYYDKVLDQFFLAKKACAGNSMSADALEELMSLTGKTIGHFKNQSARERDDADQQAVLGLLEAAGKFNPDPDVSKLAKFTTYASLWIRRRTQARKTSHCKPGMAIIKSKHVSTARIETNDGEDGHADRFHPGARSVNVGLKLDVAEAMSRLDERSQSIVMDHLVYKATLKELAEKCGLSISKIRTVIGNAKEQLAEDLASHNSSFS